MIRPRYKGERGGTLTMSVKKRIFQSQNTRAGSLLFVLDVGSSAGKANWHGRA